MQPIILCLLVKKLQQQENGKEDIKQNLPNHIMRNDACKKILILKYIHDADLQTESIWAT